MIESQNATPDSDLQMVPSAVNARAATALTADCNGLATALAVLLGIFSLFPTLVLVLVGPRQVSTWEVVQAALLLPPFSIFWLPPTGVIWGIFLMLWFGGLQIQRGREWGRRVADAAAWLLLLMPALWLSRIWGEWFADVRFNHYNNLPEYRVGFVCEGVVFLIGMMIALALKRQLWSDPILTHCGRRPEAGRAPFTRLTLFELILVLLASVGVGVLLGCWIGYRA